MGADSVVIQSQSTDSGLDPKKTPAGITGDENSVTVDREAAAKAAAEQKAKDEASKLILGKFKDQAALESAYTELEKKLGAPKDEKKTETPADDGSTPADKAQAAGLSLEDISNEYRNNGGKLSDETYAKLAKAGVTRIAADAYIEAQKTQIGTDRAALAAHVGNETDLQTLYDWAGKNLSKEELAGYNALVTGRTRNLPAAKAMLDSMINRYNEALGKDPSSIVNGATAAGDSTGIKPFRDRSEMVDAMSDPRYEKSSAYRKDVERRVAATQF